MWVIFFLSVITSEATSMPELKYDYAIHKSVFTTEEACVNTQDLLNNATLNGIQYEVVTECTFDETETGDLPLSVTNAPDQK